jgi:RNA ligase (TIGR02306 family)
LAKNTFYTTPYFKQNNKFKNKMRKLASIQRVRALEPIEGADAIEKATVLGWQLVVKKGEFRVGDLCIYVEIDSILPEKPEFEFLRNKNFRIKTIRLRGQISQGICFPLIFLPSDFEIIEDKDCTEVLEIIKYEIPIPAHLAGLMKGGFPSFIPKTDETRIQVLQNVLDKYVGTECYITEKLDGSSATFYLKDGQFGVCSRNLELLDDEKNTFWKVAKELNLEEKLRSLSGNYALQGELVGEGIQGNKLNIKGQTVFFFNIFDIDEHEFVSFEILKGTLQKLDLSFVPVLSENYILENDIPKIIAMSNIRTTMNPKAWAEGIVIRPLEETSDRAFTNELEFGGRISFKAINPEFLIKYGE